MRQKVSVPYDCATLRVATGRKSLAGAASAVDQNVVDHFLYWIVPVMEIARIVARISGTRMPERDE